MDEHVTKPKVEEKVVSYLRNVREFKDKHFSIKIIATYMVQTPVGFSYDVTFTSNIFIWLFYAGLVYLANNHHLYVCVYSTPYQFWTYTK